MKKTCQHVSAGYLRRRSDCKTEQRGRIGEPYHRTLCIRTSATGAPTSKNAKASQSNPDAPKQAAYTYAAAAKHAEVTTARPRENGRSTDIHAHHAPGTPRSQNFEQPTRRNPLCVFRTGTIVAAVILSLVLGFFLAVLVRPLHRAI